MPKSLSVKEMQELLGSHVLNEGWVSQDDLRTYGASVEGGSTVLAWKAIMALDKAGLITQKVGPDGSLPGWAVVVSAQRKRGATYGGFSPEHSLTMVLRTAAIGQMSDDGQSFTLERDDEDRFIFNAAQFKAMLEKAHMATDFLTEEGVEPPSRESVRRWRVRFQQVTLPEDADPKNLPIRIRRPVNLQGASVGELRHEALPPGTRIEWTVSWPQSHWSDENAALLLDAAQDIGFSPAGNGKYGGNRGLFRLVQTASRTTYSLNGHADEDISLERAPSVV